MATESCETSELNLPNDCLLNIYDKLLCMDDRISFGLTCKRWLHILNISLRSLVFHCSDNPKSYRLYAEILPRLLARFPNLTSVSLAGCTELPVSALSRLQDFPNLQSLALYSCFGLTDTGLSIVSNGCRHLVKVTLYRCNIGDPGLINLARACHALKSLNLSYCTMITDSGIHALSVECTKLHAVMISYCRGISGTGFRGCSRTLAYIEADSCELSPEGILEMVSGGGLEYLNVSNLRYWRGLDGIGGIGSGFARNLRFLNLRMCRFVSDESVIAIASECPLLEEWNLAVCNEVREHGWVAIGMKCERLKVLHVNRCMNLCNRGLQGLRDGCRGLKILYMYKCRKVNAFGFEMFKLLRQDVEVRNEEIMSIGPCIDTLLA